MSPISLKRRLDSKSRREVRWCVSHALTSIRGSNRSGDIPVWEAAYGANIRWHNSSDSLLLRSSHGTTKESAVLVASISEERILAGRTFVARHFVQRVSPKQISREPCLHM